MEQKSGGTIKRFLLSWGINTLAVAVAAFVVPGISYEHDWRVLLLSSLLLGVLNAVVRPLVMLLTLPLLILSLGLFMFVINAALLLLVGQIVHGFEVRNFWSALLGSIIISVVGLILNAVAGSGKARIQIRTNRPQQRPRGRGDDGGNGPVIDV